jgi:hypothetical protein
MRSAGERRVGTIGFCAGLTLGLLFLWADFSPTMGQESQRTEGISTQRPNEEATKLATWRKSMARVPLPKKGCFKATYPNNEWQEVPCVKAPSIPFQVGDGDGNDFSASAGSISSVTGSFMSVSGVSGFADETDTASGTTSSYSLQLNTNTFPTASCSGAKDPTKCSGAQQFIFANNLPIGESGNCVLGGNSCVYVRYWLIGWAQTCADGWFRYGNDCYTQYDATSIPGALSIANMQSLVLQGLATSGMDEVILTCAPLVSSATCTSLLGSDMVSEGQDSVLNLQGQWTDAEFNVFGNGNGSQARFNNPATIVVKTEVDNGSTNQPVCKQESFTGETNNLSLVNPCCPYAVLS